jgi:RNA polymerase sigma-70 factor, ECF subfamily
MATMDQAGRNRDGENYGFAAEVSAAQRGDAVALGRVLEVFRPYLLAVANQDLPAELWGKCGGSDMVQETLLEAHRGFEGFDGSRPDELRAWLRGILRHNLKDWKRRFGYAERRSIHREQSLHAGSAGRSLAAELVDPDPTPGTSAADREEAAAIDAAIERLTTDERAVIILRNRDHLSWEEVGRRLERSPDAARMLWKRAILRLQPMLEPFGGAAHLKPVFASSPACDLE